MRRWAKRFLVNIALMMLGLTLALLVGEVVVRWTGAVGEDFMNRSDPVLMQIYRPGMKGWARDGEFKTWVEINSDGFRSPQIPIAKPPGTRRIVVIGDSFTAAMQVPLEQTFHQRLAHFLPKPLQVVSLGVSGYNTAQSYLALKRYGLKYQPDLVVLAFYIGNDLTDNSPEFSSKQRPYYRLDDTGKLALLHASGARHKLRDWLNKRSALYRWKKESLGKLRRNLAQMVSDYEGYEFYQREWTPRCQRTWKVTQALIRSIRDEAEAHGAQFLLLLIPTQAQVDDARWQQACEKDAHLLKMNLDREKPSRELRVFAHQEGIVCLDLYADFRGAYQRRDARIYAGHFTPAGHELTARLLSEKIQSARLLLSQSQ